MDAVFYGGLAAELEAQLKGLEVRGIEDPELDGRHPEGMLVRFFGEPGGLMISLDRTCPAVFWTRAVAGERTVHGVPQRLLARLRGARVRAVRQPAPDRVLAMEFEAPDGTMSLWLEMTGRLANLVLTDADGLILVVSRAVTSQMNRVRQLEVGRLYVPPPLPKGWKEAADGGGTREQGSYNAEAERTWLERERTLAQGRKRGQLLAELRGRRDRRERLLGRLEAEREESAKAEALRTAAEHLGAWLHTVRKGQTEVVCERFDGQGELRIELDPKRTPAENLELLFKRARKAQRGRVLLERRCAELRVELEQLGELLGRAETADWAELLEVERELPAAPAEDELLRERRLPPGVLGFRSSDGLSLLVGRHAQGNQSVTFEVSRPRDLWFHARDYPGSHVVLVRHGKREPPARSVLEAAALAAHFSKAAGQAVVDVAYCPRHRVRSPRGAAPGQVQYSGEKTLAVRMEPELIEPLLERRLGTEAE